MKQTLHIQIKGMDCSACVMDIDGALEDLDGIEKAHTNFARELSEIIYDPKKMTEEKILHTIQTIGYSVTVVD